jgi:cell division ATPase FtsA
VGPGPVGDGGGDSAVVGLPMWSQILVTGTAGLVIGSFAAFAMNKILKGRVPPAFTLAHDAVSASGRVRHALGAIAPLGESGGGATPAMLKGKVEDAYASFSYPVVGERGEATAMVAARKGSVDNEWKLLQLTVTVKGSTRPIKLL